MNIPHEVRGLLDIKASFYNRLEFIETDPISIPRMFTLKEDIEISAFLTATISWGNRKTIIKNATRLMQWLDFAPHEFIMHATDREINRFDSFQHRTFNGTDCMYFLHSLRNIYSKHGGLESAFCTTPDLDVYQRLVHFRQIFFESEGPGRTAKHIANPSTGSSAKRLNMFLRWMVRRDSHGVDFGIWHNILPRDLYCPLDVHSGAVARKLGLLTRKQNDWKAVEELTSSLRELDPEDPVKYDFALFGMGVFEKF